MNFLELVGPVWMKQFRAAARADFEEKRSLGNPRWFSLWRNQEKAKTAPSGCFCERLDNANGISMAPKRSAATH